MTFKELNLLPALQRAVADLGYETPSPIQEQAIPPVLAGRDLIGCAQTGTGKTAAFAVPMLQRISAEEAARPQKGKRPIRALILTPTRELALQIKQSFDDYGKYLSVSNAVIFGGVGQSPQVAALQRGIDVLVATPGRLNDLSNQGYVDLSRVEFFVLDEADRMLDMGFIHDVRKVLARLPEKTDRQTLLFSATMPKEIEALAQQILNKPERVAVTPVSSTVDAIVQSLYKVDKNNKKLLLAQLLKDHPEYDSVLVFTRTKHGADRVVKELGHAGIEAMAIHGNKSQTARQTALARFKSGEIRVLVATDIAARGIDINGLACVVNYELPNVPETYVHRIGRTGRAGRDGVAISFCNFDELGCLKDIEKLIGKPVPEVTDHRWPMVILVATPKAERQPRQPRENRDGRDNRGGQARGNSPRSGESRDNQNQGRNNQSRDSRPPRANGQGQAPSRDNQGQGRSSRPNRDGAGFDANRGSRFGGGRSAGSGNFGNGGNGNGGNAGRRGGRGGSPRPGNPGSYAKRSNGYDSYDVYGKPPAPQRPGPKPWYNTPDSRPRPVEDGDIVVLKSARGSGHGGNHSGNQSAGRSQNAGRSFNRRGPKRQG